MNRTSSPEASTWSSVASIRRRAPQQRAIISQVGAMAFGRCCIAGFTDVPLRAHEERRLLDYGCGITAVVGRPTQRADEVSLEEFKAARAEFKAKIPRYAPRSIAFLGKRALSAMIGQPVLDWGRLPKENSPGRRPGFCPVRAASTGTLRSMVSSQPTQNFGQHSSATPRHARP
jgi:hypothetical protein